MSATRQTAPTAPKKSEAAEYLDMVFSSWQSMGYIKRQGKSLLVLNIGMTPTNAEEALSDWLQSKGIDRGHAA